MRTFLVCGRLHGNAKALEGLAQLAQERRPDAILFVGGIVDPAARAEAARDPQAAEERLKEDLIFMERFFQALGKTGAFAAVIPGPADAPLREFLRVGMNAEVEHPGVHVVHASLVTDKDLAVSGIGGEITLADESGEPAVRVARATAEYFLRGLWRAEQPRKVLLLAQPPTGRLGGDEGNPIVTELIDSYHPFLCAVGGETEHRGAERVAHTLVVNPGRLVSGSVAWVDVGKEPDEQVEFLDL